MRRHPAVTYEPKIEEVELDCYECAKSGTVRSVVGTCTRCNAGLCASHLQETATATVGGTYCGCSHDILGVHGMAGQNARLRP